MDGSKIVSLAIPAFNSSKYIELAFKEVVDDPIISEIVVVDDCSGDYWALEKVCKKYQKIKLFRNPENLGGFWNKRKAASLCRNEWVIVLDSDNRLQKEYLTVWKSLDNINPYTIYCPSLCRETMNYTKFGGEEFNMEGIKRCLEEDKVLATKFLNTGNYIVPKDKYLMTIDGLKVSKNVPCAIAFNYLWLKRSNFFYICPNMKYIHTVGLGRFWKNNKAYMQPIVNDIINAIETGGEYELP